MEYLDEEWMIVVRVRGPAARFALCSLAANGGDRNLAYLRTRRLEATIDHDQPLRARQATRRCEFAQAA